MSTVVDSRLVEMSFDNSDFEKNVKTSLNSLTDLDKSLENMTDNKTGIEGLGTAIDNISFGGLASAAETVGAKFDAMSVIAISALNRIVNQAMATGERLVKALSIDQVSAGWEKYAQKTEAVQTIMSATASSWEKNAEEIGFTGTQMEFVSEQLQKLNWFSDETSYSFTDMTSNIGKFTSAGISLTDAVTAMEGISTWAAKSGQNTQSASRAMYNLSQAMSVGSVKLMDWRSIENANMATQEFKNTAIETAVAVGTLKEVEEGLYKTTAGTTVTVTDFNSALSEGWFSAEVLMQTLTKYGKGATKLSEICEEYGTTASQFLTGMENYNNGTKTIDDISTNLGISVDALIPLFEELGSEEYKLGVSSFKAAQEAKTFAEAIDATKDAVSTGWMTTFETIFGNYEEAKVLWTDLANALWDVFAAGGEERNQLLTDWKTYGAIIGGGRDDLIEAFWDIWDAVGAVFEQINEAFRNVFPKTTFGDLIKYVKAFKSFAEGLMIGDETADKLNRTFTGLFSVLDIGLQIFNAFFSIVSKVFNHFAGYTSDILGVTASIGDWIAELDNSIKELGIFEEIADRIANVIIIIGEWIKKAFITTPLDAFNKGIYSVSDVLEILKTELKDFGLMFVNVIEEITGLDIVDEAGNLSGQMLEFANQLYTSFDNIFTKLTGISFDNFANAIKNIFDSVVNGIKEVGIKVGSFLGQGLGAALYGAYTIIKTTLENASENLDKFVSSSENVAKGISSVFDSIVESEFFKFLDAVFITIGSVLQTIFQLIVGAGTYILNFIKDLGAAFIGMAGDDNLFDYIRLAITALLDAGVIATLKDLIDTLEGFSLGGVSDAIESLGDALGNLSGNTEEKKIMQIGIAVALLAGSLFLLSTIKTEDLVQGISMITTLIMELMGATYGFSQVSDILGTVPKTLISLSLSVLILASAMKTISKLDPDQVTIGITTITALLADLLLFTLAMSKMNAQIAKGCASLIALALSVTILAGAMKIIATMNFDQISLGLAAIAALLASLGLFSKLVDSKRILAAGVSMIPLATGITILSVALKIIGSMSIEELSKSLISLGIALFQISGITNFINPGKILALGAAMIPLATGITILAGAMKIMGSMNIEEMLKAIATLTVALLQISVYSNFVNPGKILALGAAMIPLASGLTIIAGVMKIIGGMKIEELLKSSLALGVFLTTLSMMSVASNPVGMLALSASMLIMAGALAILVPELMLLGSIPGDKIAKIMITIAGVIGILTVAALAVQPVIGGLLALAGAIAAIGAAVALFGVGVAALSAGLAILSTLTSGSIVAILAAVEVLILGIINLLPTIALGLATAVAGILNSFKIVIKPLIELLDALLLALLSLLIEYIPSVLVVIGMLIEGILNLIIEALPQVFTVIGTFLNGLLTLIDTYVPQIAQLVFGLLVDILNVIAVNLPLIIQAGVDIIVGFIEGIADAIPQIVEAGVYLISCFLEGIASALVGVVDAAFNMIITFIDGLATAIEERGPELREAIMHLITAIVTNIIDLGVDLISTAGTLIAYLVQGLLEGIGDVASAIWDIITAAATTVSGFFGKFLTYGKTLIIKLKNGIVSMATSIATSAGDLITGAIDAIKGFFGDLVEVGHNIVQGIIDGIVEWAQNLWNSITDLAEGALSAIKDALGIASPSKEMAIVGKYFDQGFIKGVEQFSGDVNASTERLGRSSVATMLDAISHMSDELSDSDDFNPIITPVLDLSNIERDASSISSLLGNNRSLSMTSSISGTMSNNRNIQNGVNGTDNTDSNNQTYQFIQNNYSPKALSRIDIYRQTKNQFASMKGLVGGI